MTSTDLAVTRRRCTATNRSGERCGRAPIPGGTVCRVHGGAAPAVKAAAERRLALQQAESHVANNVRARGRLNLRGVYEELLTTATMAVQWRDALQERVDSLTALRYVSAEGAGSEQIRAEVTLLERSLDRVAKMLEAIARLDLDTRVSTLDAQTGDLVALALARALDTAEVDGAQRDRVEAALAGELRRLAAGVA